MEIQETIKDMPVAGKILLVMVVLVILFGFIYHHVI